MAGNTHGAARRQKNSSSPWKSCTSPCAVHDRAADRASRSRGPPTSAAPRPTPAKGGERGGRGGGDVSDAPLRRQSNSYAGAGRLAPLAISRVNPPPLRQGVDGHRSRLNRRTAQETAPSPYLPVSRPPLRNRSSA